MDVEEYINTIDEPMKSIVKKLRLAVMSTSNELKEEIKWNVPTYSINKNICSIIAHKNHVNLQIFQGANIKEANKLEGTGKEMRHLKYEKLEKIKEGKVEKLLKQAIKLDQ